MSGKTPLVYFLTCIVRKRIKSTKKLPENGFGSLSDVNHMSNSRELTEARSPWPSLIHQVALASRFIVWGRKEGGVSSSRVKNWTASISGGWNEIGHHIENRSVSIKPAAAENKLECEYEAFAAKVSHSHSFQSKRSSIDRKLGYRYINIKF